MARITVEDCLKKIPNRFQMVLVAAYRARQISQGYAPKIDRIGSEGAGRSCFQFRPTHQSPPGKPPAA